MNRCSVSLKGYNLHVDGGKNIYNSALGTLNGNGIEINWN